MMHNIPPQNRREALTQALVLAVLAPDNDKSQQALALAEQIAAGMPEADVERAKSAAETKLANL